MLEADKKKEAKKFVEEATRVQKQMEVHTLIILELHIEKESTYRQEIPALASYDGYGYNRCYWGCTNSYKKPRKIQWKAIRLDFRWPIS